MFRSRSAWPQAPARLAVFDACDDAVNTAPWQRGHLAPWTFAELPTGKTPDRSGRLIGLGHRKVKRCTTEELNTTIRTRSHSQ